MELQQSPLYSKYIQLLGWKIIRIENTRMFYKNIPLAGGLLKIQRPLHLPPLAELAPVLKEYSIRIVAIEPHPKENITAYKRWCAGVAKHCKVVRSSYQPTKTILIDVTAPEDEIFSRFTDAKRRAVRKAIKNGVTVEESGDIQNLIKIKNKSSGPFGFITTFGMDRFWPIMAPDHATTLLAYTDSHKLVGGILLVFWDKTAYYWIAGATKPGKKLFAPTHLVWEALKTAKRRGMKQFDFVGIWDERRANQHHDWLGFTKFKEGFGGKPFYYPLY
jgi:lipid II:glycine glycyltransferase (peptidoglycan interpeptide bridge formation enzyme)